MLSPVLDDGQVSCEGVEVGCRLLALDTSGQLAEVLGPGVVTRVRLTAVGLWLIKN